MKTVCVELKVRKYVILRKILDYFYNYTEQHSCDYHRFFFSIFATIKSCFSPSLPRNNKKLKLANFSFNLSIGRKNLLTCT